MIPIRDRVPTRHFPIVTLGLIIINVVIFGFELLLQAAGSLTGFIYTFGLVPYEVINEPDLVEAFTFISSMFLHGSPVHLIGNMLYLWIFGNNVEDRLGRFRFIVFYFITGILASIAQILANLDSRTPAVGASGAIAGILGAYLVMFPHARIVTLVPLGIFIRLIEIPAIIVLGFWFVLQLFSGVASFGVSQSGGVAFFAHIGGFVAGLLLIWPFMAGRRWKRSSG